MLRYIAPGTPVSLGDNGLITPAGFAESGRFLGITAGIERIKLELY